MRIRLIGQRNLTGVGCHFSNFVDQIRQISEIRDLVDEIDYSNDQQVAQAIETSSNSDVNISFVGANIHEHLKGTIVQWVVFESTLVPDILLNCLHAANQVWVPSDWGRTILIANGIATQKIHVVPEGVNANQFHNYNRNPYTKDRVFRFLTVAKYEKRKSIDEILDAWVQTYANHEAIELVIKSNYFTNQESKLKQLELKIKSLQLNNVHLLWGDMDSQELANLYRGCDIFLLPSKGEAWGLPLIEAAASGMPIITTMYSGQTEYLNHIPSSVYGVDYVLADIDCDEYRACYPTPSNYWGKWARPDVYSISAAMQTACRNYHNGLYERAQENSQLIRQQFSWSQCVDRALRTLKKTSCL